LDITIRPLTEGDIVNADHVLQAAFNTSESRRADLRRYLALQPDGFRVAVRQDSLAGLVGAVDYGPFAYIGLMAVHPASQRRGIGHALMQQLVDWLDARGTPMSLLDATVMGAPVYVSLGFVDQDQACLFQLGAPVPPLSCPENVQPLQLRDLEALCEFDTPIFGANRCGVFRMLLEDLAGRAFATRDEAGHISGYLFAQQRRLGPWAARRSEDAQASLQAALRLPFESGPSVIAPGMNSAAQELLKRFDFQFVRPARHMRRGGTRLTSQRALMYGQTSYAIG
jgi:GNAT superfamily N-acetyltransferase